MPIFTSLCAVDFGYHSGCCDDWWCWLFLRRSTAMFVQSSINELFGQHPRPCSSPKGVRANFVPSSTDATPLNNTCLLRYLRTTAMWHKVRLGLLFTSTTVAAKTPVPSTATVGVCQSPGKHNKTGRRNVLLTQEIGTSCAAAQSNHLSYFTARLA